MSNQIKFVPSLSSIKIHHYSVFIYMLNKYKNNSVKDDIFQSLTQASCTATNRCRNYDLPIAGSDALLLSYRRLVVPRYTFAVQFKLLKLLKLSGCFFLVSKSIPMQSSIW